MLNFTEIAEEAREDCRMEAVRKVDCWGGGRESVMNEQCRSLHGKLFD